MGALRVSCSIQLDSIRLEAKGRYGIGLFEE